MDATRIPVIVGVGQVNDRPADPAEGLDSLGLMDAALRAADEDAGGGWLPKLQSLAYVEQISFPELGDATQALAERLGASPKLCYKTPHANGDSPVLLLNEAANRIAAGEIEIAAVTGGEGLRTTAARRAQASGERRGDAIQEMARRRQPTWRQRYGLSTPIDIYPLYENAGRAAYGQALAEGQAETGEIWSRFSQVAAGNPGAWIRKPVSPQEIVTSSPNNRPIAFPYNKLMVANSSVNQGAGFIVASLAAARAAGVAEERLIYVGRGAFAHEPRDFLQRDTFTASPGMEVSLRRTLELNGVVAGDLDFVELYSCFPCVPKMARRVIGWPLEKPATVFGGLTFGGGPIGNYMSHAVVSMVEALRRQGRYGLLFANGGVATYNHSIVVGRDPGLARGLPHDFDFQAEADAKRGPVPPLSEAYTGPATIETYTVFYDREGQTRFGAVVGRASSGERFLARVPAADEAGIAFLTDGNAEPIGTPGEAVDARDGDIHWKRG